jgi:hypothetical protein
MLRQLVSHSGCLRVRKCHPVYLHRTNTSLSDPFNAPSSSRSDDQKLRSDVKLLGQILGSSIKEENEEVFNSVEKLRSLGRKVR